MFSKSSPGLLQAATWAASNSPQIHCLAPLKRKDHKDCHSNRIERKCRVNRWAGFFSARVFFFFPPMHCNWFSCEGAGFPWASRALFPPLPPCGVCWVLLGPLRCSAWCPALKDLCVLEVQGFLWTSWVRSACFCVEFVLL